MSQHKQLKNKSLKRLSTWTCQHTIDKSIRRPVSTQARHVGKKMYCQIPVMFLISYDISSYGGSYCYILRTSQNGKI